MLKGNDMATVRACPTSYAEDSVITVGAWVQDPEGRLCKVAMSASMANNDVPTLLTNSDAKVSPEKELLLPFMNAALERESIGVLDLQGNVRFQIALNAPVSPCRPLSPPTQRLVLLPHDTAGLKEPLGCAWLQDGSGTAIISKPHARSYAQLFEANGGGGEDRQSRWTCTLPHEAYLGKMVELSFEGSVRNGNFRVLTKEGTLVAKSVPVRPVRAVSSSDLTWLVAGGKLLRQGQVEVTPVEALREKRRLGLYFGGKWCPYCPPFSAELKSFYEEYKALDPEFEVIFISEDHSQEAAEDYFAEEQGDWLMLPYGDKRREQLPKQYSGGGIPTFVVVHNDGSVITREGRKHVSKSPSKVAEEKLFMGSDQEAKVEPVCRHVTFHAEPPWQLSQIGQLLLSIVSAERLALLPGNEWLVLAECGTESYHKGDQLRKLVLPRPGQREAVPTTLALEELLNHNVLMRKVEFALAARGFGKVNVLTELRQHNVTDQAQTIFSADDVGRIAAVAKFPVVMRLWCDPLPQRQKGFPQWLEQLDTSVEMAAEPNHANTTCTRKVVEQKKTSCMRKVLERKKTSSAMKVVERKKTFVETADWMQGTVRSFLVEAELHGKITKIRLESTGGPSKSLQVGSPIWDDPEALSSLTFPVTLKAFVELKPSDFSFDIACAAQWSRASLLALMQSTCADGPEDFWEMVVTDSAGQACTVESAQHPWGTELPSKLVFPLKLAMKVLLDPLNPRVERDIEIQLEHKSQWDRNELRSLHRLMRVRTTFDLVRLTIVDSRDKRIPAPVTEELMAGVPWKVELPNKAFPVRLNYTVLMDGHVDLMSFPVGVPSDGWCQHVLEKQLKLMGIENEDFVVFKIEDSQGQRWDLPAYEWPPWEMSPRSLTLAWPATLTALAFVPKERADNRGKGVGFRQLAVNYMLAMLMGSDNSLEEFKNITFLAWKAYTASKPTSRVEMVGVFKCVKPTGPKWTNDEGAPVARGTSDGIECYYCSREYPKVSIAKCGPDSGPQCESCRRFQGTQRPMFTANEPADTSSIFIREFLPHMRIAEADIGYFIVRDVNKVVYSLGADLPAFVGKRAPERRLLQTRPAFIPGFLGEVGAAGARNEAVVFKVVLGREVVSFHSHNEHVSFFSNRPGRPRGMYFVRGDPPQRTHFTSMSFDWETGGISFDTSGVVLRIPPAEFTRVLPLLQNAAVVNQVEAVHFDEFWICEEGLPSLEGLSLSMDRRGISTVRDMHARCSANPDCVGFAYNTSDGQWFPRKIGSGFADAKYMQKVDGQVWQWHCIPSRMAEFVVEFRDVEPTGAKQLARFYLEAGMTTMQVCWGKPAQRCSFAKAIYNEETHDLMVYPPYCEHLGPGAKLRIHEAVVGSVLTKLRAAVQRSAVELKVLEVATRPELGQHLKEALAGRWQISFDQCSFGLTIEPDGTFQHGGGRVAVMSAKEEERAAGWQAHIKHRLTRRGYQEEHDGYQLLKLDGEQLVLKEMPGALMAVGALETTYASDVEASRSSVPEEGEGLTKALLRKPDPDLEKGVAERDSSKEIGEGDSVKFPPESEEDTVKGAFAGTGFDWKPEMKELLGQTALVVEELDSDMVLCQTLRKRGEEMTRKWPMPKKHATVVVQGREPGKLGGDMNLQAYLVFLVVFLCLICGFLALDCSLGPFAPTDRPYPEDYLAAAVEMDTQPPWLVIPIKSSLQVVLFYMILGMDLKFSPPKVSVRKARMYRFMKACVLLILTGLVIKTCILDAGRVVWSECSSVWERVLLALVVVSLSPNFPMALGMWSRLAIQSPASVMRVVPKYRVLKIFDLEPIGFPLMLGAASWISPFEQIYAYCLLPYMLCKEVLLKVLQLFFGMQVVLDILLCRCHWIFICVVTSCSVAFWITTVVMLLAGGLAAYAIQLAAFSTRLVWPLIYLALFQAWASIVPLLFARLYAYILRLNWLDVFRAVLWNTDVSMTSLITELGSLSTARDCSRPLHLLKDILWKWFTWSFRSGIPKPLNVNRREKELLKEYNKARLAKDFENSEANKQVFFGLDNHAFDIEEIGEGDPSKVHDRAMSAVKDQLADHNDDVRTLKLIKVAIVAATLQSIVNIGFTQLSVMFWSRIMHDTLHGVSIQKLSTSLTRTLVERRMSSWAAGLRQTQLKVWTTLPTLLRWCGVDVPLPELDGICPRVEGFLGSEHSFLQSPVEEPTYLYSFVTVSVLMVGVAAYMMRQKLSGTCKEKGFALLTLVFCAVMCLVSRGNYQRSRVVADIGIAAVYHLLRVCTAIFVVLMEHQIVAALSCVPEWYVSTFNPELNTILSFFGGLEKDHDADSAKKLVDQVLNWGGVYPKLAQRLCIDKNVIKAKVLRSAFSKVMEQCTSRTKGEVVTRLCEEMLLKEEDVDFQKTLGTGSVAQVVLVGVRQDGEWKSSVFKMTWPEDESRFKENFAAFESLQRKVSWLSRFAEMDRLVIFLNAVLAKKQDILDEFDLTQEFSSTMRGKELVDRWAAPVLENNAISLVTLEHMKAEVVRSGTPLEKIRDMSKAELRTFIIAQRDRQAYFTFTDANGAVVTVKQRGSNAECYVQGLGQMDALEGVDATTGEYWTSGKRTGVVPKGQLAEVRDYLAGTLPVRNDDHVVISSSRGWVIKEPDDSTRGYIVALEGGGTAEDLESREIKDAFFMFKDEEGAVVTVTGYGAYARASVELPGGAGAFVLHSDTGRYESGNRSALVPPEQVRALESLLSRGVVDRFLPTHVRGGRALEPSERPGEFRVCSPCRLYFHNSPKLADVDLFAHQLRPGDVVAGVEANGWVKVQVRPWVAPGDMVITSAGDLGTVIGGPDQRGRYSVVVEVSASSASRLHTVVEASDVERLPFSFTDADGAVVTVTCRPTGVRCSVMPSGPPGAFESFEAATLTYRVGIRHGTVPKSEKEGLLSYLAGRSSPMDVFTVDLDVEGVDDLGLDLIFDEKNRHYTVKSVFAGPVHEWNLEHPFSAVKQDSIIQRINDEKPEPTSSLVSLASKGRLRLAVQSTLKTESKRPTLGDMVEVIEGPLQGQVARIAIDERDDEEPYVLEGLEGKFGEEKLKLFEAAKFRVGSPVVLPSQTGFVASSGADRIFAKRCVVNVEPAPAGGETEGPALLGPESCAAQPEARLEATAEDLVVPPFQFQDEEGRDVKLLWLSCGKGGHMQWFLRTAITRGCGVRTAITAPATESFSLHGFVYRAGKSQGTVPGRELPFLKAFLAHRVGSEVRYPVGLRVEMRQHHGTTNSFTSDTPNPRKSNPVYCVVDGPRRASDVCVTLLGMNRRRVPLSELRRASLKFVDQDGREVRLIEPAGRDGATCFVQEPEEKAVTFQGYDKETRAYRTTAKQGTVAQVEAEELEAHLEGRDPELRCGDHVEVLRVEATVTKVEPDSGLLRLRLKSSSEGVEVDGEFRASEVLHTSFQFENDKKALITVMGHGDDARFSTQEPGDDRFFGGFDLASREYRAGSRSGQVPEDQVQGLRAYLSNENLLQQGETVRLKGRRGKILANQCRSTSQVKVLFEDGEENEVSRSDCLADGFTFTDEEGLKISITGLGPLATCSVEQPGAAGAFTSKGLKPTTMSYEAGGQAGKVGSKEAAQRLAQYLSEEHSQICVGDTVMLRGGSAQILELQEGKFRICYSSHSGVVQAALPAFCFTRSSFTFSDTDGDVVTIFGRGPGARCVVTREAMAFEGLDLLQSQYHVAGRAGKVSIQQVDSLRDYLQGGASDLVKGDRVVLRNKMGHITEIREGSGFVKVSFEEESTPEAKESEFVPVEAVTRKNLSVTVKSPAAKSHSRFILEQDFVKGKSLEWLMKRAAWARKVREEGLGAEGLRITDDDLEDLTDLGFNRNNIDILDDWFSDAIDAYTHVFVPMLGGMLMHDGFGHADPHLGNLLFDPREKTLWVIDWGVMLELGPQQRSGLRDLCHELCMAEVEEPESMEKVNAVEADFLRTGGPIGASFWRWVLHPQKHSQPEGLDLDALKRSLRDPTVVLRLEVMLLTSRALQKMSSSSSSQMPPTALLSLWDDIVTLPSPAADLSWNSVGPDLCVSSPSRTFTRAEL